MIIEELKADVKRLQKAHYNEMVDHEETKTRLGAENRRLRKTLQLISDKIEAKGELYTNETDLVSDCYAIVRAALEERDD